MSEIFQDTFSFTVMLSGIICLLAGFIMNIFPPKKINDFYGYRSRRSKKNLENWQFAQTFSSKTMIWSSIVLIAVGYLGTLIEFPRKIAIVIALAIIIAWSIFLIRRTERALKEFEEKN